MPGKAYLRLILQYFVISVHIDFHKNTLDKEFMRDTENLICTTNSNRCVGFMHRSKKGKKRGIKAAHVLIIYKRLVSRLLAFAQCQPSENKKNGTLGYHFRKGVVFNKLLSYL